jgi:hypothetical protein
MTTLKPSEEYSIRMADAQEKNVETLSLLSYLRIITGVGSLGLAAAMTPKQ